MRAILAACAAGLALAACVALRGDGALGAGGAATWLLIVALAAAVGFQRTRRGGGATAAAALLLGAAAAAWLGASAASDDAWAARERVRLAARLAGVQQDVGRLREAVAALRAAAAEDAGDPAQRLEHLRRDWPLGAAGPFPLGLAFWRDGERLAWSGVLEPFPAQDLPAPAEPALVQQGRLGWVWRGSVEAADGRVEWQVRLTREGVEARSRHGSEDRLRTQVVLTSEPQSERWLGSSDRGHQVVADVVLDSTPGDMELPVLRVTVASASRPAREAARSARARLLVLLLASVALLAGAGTFRGGAVLVMLWALRLAWAALDVFHRLPVAWPASDGAGGPGALASLTDPTYFATPWGLGLFASTADAVLTGALLCATVLALPAGRRAIGGRAQIGAAGFGAATGAGLLLLALLARQFAANAHPHLVGPRIPFTAITFWGLHLALALISVALAVAGTRLADRLRAAHVWRQLPAVAAGAAVVALGASRLLAWGEAVLLPVLAGLLWAAAAARVDAERTLRRLLWLLPVLLTVVWNHVALVGAYDRVEHAWLERTIEELTAPRSDWARFLLEDLLGEMAADEAVLQNPPRAHAPEAVELWADWPAFALWRGSGLRELGLACNVEILDDDGLVQSRFASGLFRDAGYEIVARSNWETARPADARAQEIFFQSERRRYATGDEWILRGETARIGTGGWLSLELPVRTGRVSTMRHELGPEDAADGYAPRRDVDRPLLLLRREADGWRGDGASEVPGPEAAPALARLRAGGTAAAVIPLGDHRWRCLWRDAPADEETDAEGYLLGVRVPSLGDRLLDLSRMLLLDLMLLAGAGLLAGGVRLAARRHRWDLGVQERFLLLSILLGLLPLVMAGTFIDRLSREWLADDAREQTRQSLETAREQLQGLLAEQARALAASDYINDLLSSRYAGSRPQGPFSIRQAMVFSADGELLLDETLSDLDPLEAAAFLETARRTSLVVTRDAQGAYLGTVIPVSLEDRPTLDEAEALANGAAGPGVRPRDGYFFYRQRLDGDLLAGLADVIQGEAVLYVEGEALLASHPDHVFAGSTDLLLPGDAMAGLAARPGGMLLAPGRARDLAWTGLLAMPSLSNGDDGVLRRNDVPAVLATSFPARGREFAAQRERTVLFLAGLATLIFLLATVLGLSLTWRIFEPVRVLVHATRRLAAGDFAAPLPRRGEDELGTLSAAFGAMRDDLREAQTALAERERFLARLLERVPVGVAVFGGEDGAVVSLNPAAERLLASYADPDDPDPGRAAARLLAAFTAAVPGGDGDAELATPAGDRTLRGRLAPLVLPDGRRDRMIVVEDVTEFLETKRLAINAQLARQVAHEVKNPLTPIQLSVQFLQQAWRDRAPNLDSILESTVKQVLEQVELLRQIATEFSLLGRPEDLACEPTDLRELVHGVLRRYRGADAEALGVAESGGPPPLVLAHRESLAKVIGNLLENSLQAAGGADRLHLELAWRVEERTVALIWRDDGPGLEPGVADRLFDLYFSTKSHGTGLGLPICRSLLTRMQGGITLSNRTDARGAEAVVTLRRADAAGAGTGTRSA